MEVETNIVVICFNALNYTKATIKSLFDKTNSPYYLTIVDNGSNKDTINYLENLKLSKYCKEYSIIRNSKNMGVGYAYNQGFQLSIKKDLKYTCFCNNDLYFSTNWLKKLEKSLNDNPNIALVNPLRPSMKTVYSSGISAMARLMRLNENSDYIRELEDFTNMPLAEFEVFCKKITQINQTHGKDGLELIRFPDSLSTCICLANNKHIKELGKFADPKFKKYGSEDIDTSWSLMRLGYDCAIAKNVYIHHFRGKSLIDNNFNRRELLNVSNKILYDKWREEIKVFLLNQEARGVNIREKIIPKNNQLGNDYWLLSQLNNDVNILKEVICGKEV